MSKLKNYFYNAAYTYLFWGLVGWLSQYSEIIAAFEDSNIFAQCFVFTWITLLAFILIIKLKESILADRKITQSEKRKGALALLIFLPLDATLNVVFISPLFLQPANSKGEGWLLTDHARAIRKYSMSKILGGKDLTILEAWRFWHCEKWIGPIMNMVERNHYSG